MLFFSFFFANLIASVVVSRKKRSIDTVESDCGCNYDTAVYMCKAARYGSTELPRVKSSDPAQMYFGVVCRVMPEGVHVSRGALGHPGATLPDCELSSLVHCRLGVSGCVDLFDFNIFQHFEPHRETASIDGRKTCVPMMCRELVSSYDTTNCSYSWMVAHEFGAAVGFSPRFHIEE